MAEKIDKMRSEIEKTLKKKMAEKVCEICGQKFPETDCTIVNYRFNGEDELHYFCDGICAKDWLEENH